MAHSYSFTRVAGRICGWLLFLLVSYSAQGQQWRWAQQVHNSLSQAWLRLTPGLGGESFVYGSFEDTLHLPSTTLYSRGKHDAFVGKVDSAGNWLWVTQFGGAGEDRADVRADTLGNFYLFGTASAGARFGNLPLLADSGSFVVKLTAVRAIAWVRQVNGLEDFQVDYDGKSYVSGAFNDSLQFGSHKVYEYIPVDSLHFYSRGTDVYLAGLDANGNWQWALAGGGPGVQDQTAIATSGHGDVVLLGRYRPIDPTQDFTQFGSSVLSNYDLSLSDKCFVVKPDPAHHAWQSVLSMYSVNSMGWPDAWWCHPVRVDRLGNLYLMGRLSGGLVIGQDTVVGPTVGYVNFVTKLSARGSVAFTNVLETSQYGALWASLITTEDDASFYCSILAADTLRLGAITLPIHLASFTDNPKPLFISFDSAGRWHAALRLPVAAHSMNLLGGHAVMAGWQYDSVQVGSQWFAPQYYHTLTIGNSILAQLALPPFIHRFSPAGGGTGTVVTLTGTGFTGTTQVLFGGVPASFTVVDDHTIIVTVPPGVSTLAAGVVIAVVNGAGPGYAVTNFYPRPNGLDDERSGAALTLWPNPAHGTVQLTGLPAEGATGQVIDALGRVVYTALLEPHAAHLDLRGCRPGVYTVRVGAVVRRLVVE